MSLISLDQYIKACDYPGELDADAVESHLVKYLTVFGMNRKIVRITSGWEPSDYPDLAQECNEILNDFSRRSGLRAVSTDPALSGEVGWAR